MKFQCQKCGKVLGPKNGKVSCCGITETVGDIFEAHKDYEREIKVSARLAVDRILPKEPEDHFFQDETDL